MDKFILKPLSGVNNLKFGKSRDEIIEEFDEPTEEEGRTDYYELEEYSVALSYDRNDRLEFIEFGKVENGIGIFINDIDVFNTDAEELLEKMKKLAGEKPNSENSEPPYTFVFDSIEIAIDRPTIPEDYEDGQEDTDGYEKGKFFRSIGIGCKGYFSNAEMVD